MASLLKNVAAQNITFLLLNASTGAPDTGASPAVHITIDNAAQAAGTGSFTNKGLGQYNYTLGSAAESNGQDVGFIFSASGDLSVNADFHTDPQNWAALNIDALGNIGVQATLKRNTAVGIPFVMTDNVNHNPAIGLTVTCTRSIDNGVFTTTTNAPVENSNGWYFVSLLAAEVNGRLIALRMVASGADDLDLAYPTVP